MATTVDTIVTPAAELAAGVLTVLGLATPAALVALVPVAVTVVEQLVAAGVDVPGLTELRARVQAFERRAPAPTDPEE